MEKTDLESFMSSITPLNTLPRVEFGVAVPEGSPRLCSCGFVVQILFPSNTSNLSTPIPLFTPGQD